MATVTYLNSATNETYSDAAFEYIKHPRVKDSITNTSAILCISAGVGGLSMAGNENTLPTGTGIAALIDFYNTLIDGTVHSNPLWNELVAGSAAANAPIFRLVA